LAVLLAFAWLALFGKAGTVPRIGIILGGLLAVGGAVAWRPASVGILGTACLADLFACGALDPEWDSLRLLLLVLSAVAGFAAVVMLLPRAARRAVVSLLIVLHFAGIANAVLTVHPTPWLASYTWTHFYRYYLEFMYLSNAYHFYAPEPGPATLMWSYVKYDDGTGQLVEVPRWDAFRFTLQYQRRLPLTETINQLTVPDAKSFPAALYRRLAAGQQDGVPLHPDLEQLLQYRVPTIYAQRMMESYARYLARSTAHPTDPRRKVTGIKIYRVVHSILYARELASGLDPEDPSVYHTFYQGEFTPEGQLKTPDDPYLYWLIPIYREKGDNTLHDFLKVHVRLASPAA
jgi:hypothetical protein